MTEQSSYFKGNARFAVLGLFLVLVGSIGLDQVSKHHMHQSLLVWEDPKDSDSYQGGSVSLWKIGKRPQFTTDKDFYFGFGWQYSRNKGAAFSMFSEIPDSVRVPMFYIITLLASVFIFMYLRSTPIHHYLTRYGLILILSGALGNCLDRLQHGYVIDFVDVEWNVQGWHHNFAIFNVADVAINVGIICLLLDILVQYLRERKLKKH